MGLTVSHASALEIIRKLRADGHNLRTDFDHTAIRRPVPWCGERWAIREFHDESWHWTVPSKDRPLHIAVPSGRCRVRMDTIESHVCSPQLPASAALFVDERLSITSPAMTFLQLAVSLDMSALVLLGFELCGTYVLCDEGTGVDGEVLNVPPALTVDELRQFLDQVPQRMRGLR